MQNFPTVETAIRGKIKTNKFEDRRPSWYVNRSFLRPSKQYTWSAKERALLYELRVVKKWSLPKIQQYFRKRHGIPVFLSPNFSADKFSLTRLHNQIRLSKASMQGKCYICSHTLTKEDRKRSESKSDLKICRACFEKTEAYKRKKREDALKAGLCGACNKRRRIKGKSLCRACISSTQRYRYIQGLCGTCGKKPISKDSISLCDSCLKKNRKYSNNYRLQKKQVLK